MKKSSFAIASAASLALAGAVWAQSLPAQNATAPLDADGNGLYDDAERKQLIDVLQQNVPSIKGATFDADGDGKVTVLEQAQGRHPLTMTIGGELLKSGVQIPWAIDAFPEWITTAYVQEDVAEGTVAEHPTRGNQKRHGTQESEDSRPRRAADRGGVEFAANTGQHLTAPGSRNAQWDYRWTLLTFRIDKNTGSANETVLLDLNKGDRSLRSSPKVWFDKQSGLHVQFVGRNKGGLDRRIMVADNVVADGETWNVLACGMRYGQMYATVNGVELSTQEKQPPRFAGELPPGEGLLTHLGDARKTNMAWAYDALVFGLTEPSEAMVRKLTAWAAHRVGSQKLLPENHPYRAHRPTIDREDFPYRYLPNEEQRLAWIGKVKGDVEAKMVNAAGPRVEPEGFERAFYDDFRANRLSPSTSGEGDLWQGPGWNSSVGVDAPMLEPGRTPDVYPYDAEKQHQGVSVANDGGNMRSGAIYTINNQGHGHTWRGPKIFRVRARFDKPLEGQGPPGGLFSGFWSYDNDFLFWRTANRIEIDYLEFDGMYPNYLNSFSTHLHYSHWRENIHALKPAGYPRAKGYGGELTEEKSKLPGGIYIWDGEFRTWEFVITEGTTYVNVTLADKDGKERWVEVYRIPTEPTYLERLDLHFNLALKGRRGGPAEGKRESYAADWIEVLQKTDQLQQVPAPFTAKPKLAGSVTAGSTITCEPNVEGVTDIRYFWYADGYPLTWGTDNTYKITEAEAGKSIRCMVKAVGALDKPEAWSDVIK
ncbi:MAG TPA: hypothetical protein VGN72_19545 [Tepidisphaeraceae bacterium]|jgi:hypothetical protein|nr:hypothetical protein [Tepidisphaeraceae bacterium]